MNGRRIYAHLHMADQPFTGLDTAFRTTIACTAPLDEPPAEWYVPGIDMAGRRSHVCGIDASIWMSPTVQSISEVSDLSVQYIHIHTPFECTTRYVMTPRGAIRIHPYTV